MTMTDPEGNQIVSSTSWPSTGPGRINLHVDSVSDYQGSSSSGTLLKTTSTGYAQYTSPPMASGYLILPITETTTVPGSSGNLVSQVSQTYDAGFTYTDYYSIGYAVPYGLVEGQYNYDWGGALLSSVTTSSHEAFNSSQYLAANLLTLPYRQYVYDGSGNLSVRGRPVDTTIGHRRRPGLRSNTRHQLPGVYGNLSDLWNWASGPGCQGGSWVHTLYQSFYDTGMTQWIQDANGNQTTYAYANENPNWYGSRLTTVTDALGHTNNFGYDWPSGLLNYSQDANGNWTNYVYDNMFRPTQVNYPDGGQITASYSSTSTTVSQAIASGQSPLTTVQLYDALGRLQHTQLTSDPEGTDYTDTTYDDLGRVASVSNPYRSVSDATYGVTQYHYDPLGRVTSVTEQDGSTQGTSYDGQYTTTTDEAGKVRKSLTDGLGRVTDVWEDPTGLNYHTTYSYDPLGNLTSVLQNASRQRTFTYDGLSRLLSSTDPESGTTTYTYDANGNILTRARPAPNQTNSSRHCDDHLCLRCAEPPDSECLQ